MASLHETLSHRLADAAELVEYGWQERNDWNVRFTVLGSIAIISFVSWLFSPKTVKAPYAGYRSAWEPTLLLRMRFITGARPIIIDGYNKFKRSMFKLRRMDSDVLIISNKYVDELRQLPESIISPIHAHIKNVMGKYTTADLMLEGNLHTRVLQAKLTPNLVQYMDIVQQEMDFAFDVEMPQSDDWTEVQIGDIMLRIIARISARTFVGLPLCRNEEWLHTSIHYTENLFMTAFALRMMPTFLHPFLVWFLPSWYRVHNDLKTAKKLIVPLVKEHAVNIAASNPEGDDTVLKWMMGMAQDANEANPNKLAHRQLLLSLASIHTTGMATTHTLYDLAANPEYIAEMREEVENVLIEDGGMAKQTLSKFRKLESLMKESQRLNPPSYLAFNRTAMKPITLSDGVQIHKGTHFAVASGPILLDAENNPEPDKFDPLRFYRKRQNPGEANKHLLPMTDKNHLHFGHGKYACPGRFFAVLEMKMILARILLDYEFKYPEGQGRPKNLTMDENVLPDPAARLLVRKRQDKNDKVPTLYKSA
ncbi:cytochrome P450 [Aspergillus candidus]|uniref:Cytochrome P450 n=1 Tax=Aspergillus candidus TaxID=41067 RepID=A0A2I2FHP4_ASPCN|nr:cytochrome P450 [Aspergillus candidus]PLB40143.1 cytochrome P450 [Aspergillus candidus]